MRKIRWGILGTASIAMRRLVPAIQRSQTGEVTAIASREAAKAEAAARDAGVPRWCGSYQELLDDPAIDAIYLPLPNHLHAPWGIRVIEAGKHLLCEKPVALSAAEAATIHHAASRAPTIRVMEAFMYRFHPRWQAIHEHVHAGKLGVLQSVHTTFSYDNTRPNDIRNQVSCGGGALLDIGCYGISVARWLFRTEPKVVRGAIQTDPVFGTDMLTSGLLEFGIGHATFSAATQLPWHQHVSIIGTAGRIEVVRPFNPADGPSSFQLFEGDVVTERTFAAADQYQRMVDAFGTSILDDTPVPTPFADAVANMATIDAITLNASRA